MRRPARLERAGALTPRDRIWAAIRGFGTQGGIWFSVAEIMVLTGESVQTVTRTLAGLEAAGYIADAMELRTLPLLTRRELRRYLLVRDVGVDAPRVDERGRPVTEHLGQQQMWAAARKRKGDFDWRELVQACPHPVTLHAAKQYLRHLERAGYLARARAARGTRPARYRFIRARDTGPRAPLITGHRAVMDGNTGEIVQGGKADAKR